MPFKKVDINSVINERLKNDIALQNAYEQAQNEYEVVKQLIEMRNTMGFSQSELARQSGLTQQMISRIETVENSPTLRNLIKYADGLNLQIKFEKKKV